MIYYFYIIETLKVYLRIFPQNASHKMNTSDMRPLLLITFHAKLVIIVGLQQDFMLHGAKRYSHLRLAVPRPARSLLVVRAA